MIKIINHVVVVIEKFSTKHINNKLIYLKEKYINVILGPRILATMNKPSYHNCNMGLSYNSSSTKQNEN